MVSARHLCFPAALLLLLGAAFASPSQASGRDDAPSTSMAGEASPATSPAQPMVVVRMRAKDWCGRRCPEWIVAEGTITRKTPEQLRRVLAELGNARLPVVLDSRGGDIDAAMDMGRMIRAKGLTTIIGRSEVQGCAPRDAGCRKGGSAGLPYTGYVVPAGECARACLLVLAAGKRRIGYWITEAPVLSGDAAGRVGTYLTDMGISPGLIARLRRSGLPLDRAEMLHFGFATGRERVEDFTGSSICVRPVPATNCLRLAAIRQPAPLTSTKAPSKPAATPSTRVVIWGAIEDM